MNVEADPGRLDVLLVEDDDDHRELVAEVLASAGWAVHSVASGREALRILSERSVQLVVTDLGMPGMGGMELVHAARELAPSVPVVVVTGWAERDDLEQARGRAVAAVLVKPVDPARLTETVASVLAGRGRTARS